MTDWSDCLARIAPQVVRIQAADRTGTGLIHYGTDGGARCVATARHLMEPVPGQQRPFLVIHGATLFRYGMFIKPAEKWGFNLPMLAALSRPARPKTSAYWESGDGGPKKARRGRP
ncbi:MAG: hypothetical protein OXU77_22615 [Gammaproteobacteria bacterium]|nr:hypothetical protein [Gammaproteobacteria bacterium]